MTVYSHCTHPKCQERRIQRKCPLMIGARDLRQNTRKDTRLLSSLWPQVDSPDSVQLLCQEHFTLCYYILNSLQPSDSVMIGRAQFMNWNGQMFSIYSLSIFMDLQFYIFYIFFIFNKWCWLQSVLPCEIEKQKCRDKKQFYSFKQF